MKPGAVGRIVPTVGGLVALLLGVAAIDDDLRASIADLFTGGTSSSITSFGWHMEDAARQMMQTVRYQSMEHAPLMIFAVAATVLLLFMLRT